MSWPEGRIAVDTRLAATEHRSFRAAAFVLASILCLISGCGFFFGYPNTNLGALQDAQNRRINDRERATEPPSKRLPTNLEQLGSGYDAAERSADLQLMKDVLRLVFFGPPAPPPPDRSGLPRCLEDEVYSCSVTNGCRCRIEPASAPPDPAPER